MLACVDFGNPFRVGQLRQAFVYGKRRRLRGQLMTRQAGFNDRVWHAFRAGYLGWGWHRTPGGVLVWHRRGA